MTEIYAMPLSTVAVWLAWQTFMQQRPPRFGIVAGLCGALAISFRLPLALSALGVLLACILAARHTPPGQTLASKQAILSCTATHALGAVLGLLFIFIHPICAGYLHDCLDAAILWPLGLTGEHVSGPLALATTERLADFAQDFAKLGWLHLPAIAGLALALRGPRRRLAHLIGIWYVTATASAALGWASYAHYQYVAFAPACAACGLLLSHLKPAAASKAAIALLGLAVLVVGIQGGKEIMRHAACGSDASHRAVVEHIRSHTTPNDTVYIWAWNRSASLLCDIDRPPGNRHFMAHSYFNMDLSLFDEMVESFVADPPVWIVVDRERRKPLIIGPPTSDWERAIPALARLREFVEHEYRLEAEHGAYLILRLASDRPAPS